MSAATFTNSVVTNECDRSFETKQYICYITIFLFLSYHLPPSLSFSFFFSNKSYGYLAEILQVSERTRKDYSSEACY